MSIGRNDACTCGSGKKFKKCCLGKVTNEWGTTGENPAIEVLPKPLKQQQFFIDRGVREFVLATIEWGQRVLKSEPVDQEQLGQIFQDLGLFATTSNQREAYMDILKSTFKARNESLRASQVMELKKLTVSQPVLLHNEQALLNDIATSCLLDLKPEFAEPDYGMISIQLEFAFIVIKDVLLEQQQFVDHVQLIVDEENGQEFLTNWSIQYQQLEQGDLPQPVMVEISHLNEGYNTLQKVKNDYPLLEEKTKKNLASALYYTEYLDNKIQQYLFYDEIILALITSMEKEFRTIIGSHNPKNVNKLQFVELINEFYDHYEASFTELSKDEAHELRKIRNQLAHGERSAKHEDFIAIKAQLIDHQFFLAIQNIKQELRVVTNEN